MTRVIVHTISDLKNMELVSVRLAKLLKEKGFDQSCKTYDVTTPYISDTGRKYEIKTRENLPTINQTLDWLVTKNIINFQQLINIKFKKIFIFYLNRNTDEIDDLLIKELSKIPFKGMFNIIDKDIFDKESCRTPKYKLDEEIYYLENNKIQKGVITAIKYPEIIKKGGYVLNYFKEPIKRKEEVIERPFEYAVSYNETARTYLSEKELAKTKEELLKKL